jgi:hypothetical protein
LFKKKNQDADNFDFLTLFSAFNLDKKKKTQSHLLAIIKRGKLDVDEDYLLDSNWRSIELTHCLLKIQSRKISLIPFIVWLPS